jgi:FMN reductase
LLDGTRGAGVHVTSVSLADESGRERALSEIETSEAVILGSPVYRASMATPLKRFLDLVPRAWDGNRDSPLGGKAVAIVLTGASDHHFLALNDLRNVLAGFFAAHVLPPGLYVPHNGFGADATLLEPYLGQALLQGRAVLEMAAALASSTALSVLGPQV